MSAAVRIDLESINGYKINLESPEVPTEYVPTTGSGSVRIRIPMTPEMLAANPGFPPELVVILTGTGAVAERVDRDRRIVVVHGPEPVESAPEGATPPAGR